MPRTSPILDASGDPYVVESPRYESQPAWGTRHWEAAETNRLNSAHWTFAQDRSINEWLSEHLPTLRSRATYESRQNGMLAGVIQTNADDIVGPDGPTLQVLSKDKAYNEAHEEAWRDWWAAPTFRPNVSGPALLKLWVRQLWRSGEYLARIDTDPTASGPVAMRLRPTHPRRLATPIDAGGDPNVVMGIRFDRWGRPATYYIADAPINGQAAMALTSQPWPADMIVHEFILDEEDQARGFPWCTPALTPAANLRDYNDYVQEAAKSQASRSGMLYTEHTDAPYWAMPESTTVEPGQIYSAPPGWKWQEGHPTQPSAQYESYQDARLREFGRPVSMPLLMVKLDASKHNYSSARLDTQCYDRAIAGIQTWISGSKRSCGTLSRLAAEVAREAQLSVPAMRRRPQRVRYQWTWPPRPHVDPTKEAMGEAIGLQNMTLLLGDAVAARGGDLETHLEKLRRQLDLMKDLPIPAAWLNNPNALLAMLAQDNGAEETDGQPVTSGA